jgi:predicted transcriptional regulator
MRHRDSTQIAFHILVMLGSSRALPTYSRGGLYRQLNICTDSFEKAVQSLEDKGLVKRAENTNGFNMVELTMKGYDYLKGPAQNLALLFV